MDVKKSLVLTLNHLYYWPKYEHSPLNFLHATQDILISNQYHDYPFYISFHLTSITKQFSSYEECYFHNNVREMRHNQQNSQPLSSCSKTLDTNHPRTSYCIPIFYLIYDQSLLNVYYPLSFDVDDPNSILKFFYLKLLLPQEFPFWLHYQDCINQFQ